MANLVVKYLNGEVKKGRSEDFLLQREVFHLQLLEDRGESLEIPVAELKAVFFVDEFEGKPGYRDNLKAKRPSYRGRVRVRFSDGEVLEGYTEDDRSRSRFLRLVPADPLSNNTLIFAVRENLESLERIET